MWRLQRRLLGFFLVSCVAVAAFASTARAAELDGVEIPDTVQAGGKVLHLNGFGLRTYSVLRFHIYVAALYLEHPSSDPEAILNSPQTKLLTVSFLHDVSAERERKSWQVGFADNCVPPACALKRADIDDFLAHVPPARAGDRFTMLFDTRGAAIKMDDHPLGVIPRPDFAEAMLATFLGPRPGSVELKSELLSAHAGQANQ